MATPSHPDVLLEVKDLRTHFFTDAGVLPSVDGISFTVGRGEAVGIVGESGCGKSVMSMSILRLIPQPPGRIVGGEIVFHPEGSPPIDLVKLPMAELRKVRGNSIAMIFQEPMTSLNPVYTVGDQIAESVILHQGKDAEEAREIAIKMLEEVGIPAARQRVDEYPHQLSGGMKQRVMIAMALACNPDLLIADEPTTALDVSVQAQVISLLRRLGRQHRLAVLLVTHDMGVIAEACDRVAVMYAGRIVEIGPVREVIHAPAHPYTAGLMGSIPPMTGERERLLQIDGAMPRLGATPAGCAFHPRCPSVMARCRTERPELMAAGVSRAACWLHDVEALR
jgi:peptide/nickel transport system ATP-binding protein